MYVLEDASAAVGVNVAVFVGESYVTVPATEPSPAFVTVKLELVIVVGSIARENVALIGAVTDTPVAPEAGDVELTVGGPAGAAGTTSSAVSSGSSAEP